VRGHEAASGCMLLADSTTYRMFSKFQVTALDNLDVILSDLELPDDTQSRTEELGVEMRAAIV
jgi:DeoR/GlpR family transcriptional regulator of sugar metabolism